RGQAPRTRPIPIPAGRVPAMSPPEPGPAPSPGLVRASAPVAALGAAGKLRWATEGPQHAFARGSPWRSRERLSHSRSVVGGDQQYAETHKNTDIEPAMSASATSV